MAWPASRLWLAAGSRQGAPRCLGLQRRNLTQKTLDIVKETLPAVGAAGTSFTSHFYKRMFKQHPELLYTFNLTNQREGRQQKALFSAIAASATSVLQNGTLPVSLLEGVNHKHCALHVVPAQYDVVGEHILGTIDELMSPGQEVLGAWGELYGALAGYCVKREEEIYKEVESKAGGWRGMRKFAVKEKVSVSESIMKFTFAPVDGQPICSYSPGQYLTIWTHPTEGTRQPRHYSLVSSPGDDVYTIAVKKEEKGLVSSFLHDRTAVGDEFDLTPPYGAFTCSGAPELWLQDKDAPVVLLSAGVGITPMLSMLGSLKNGVAPFVATDRPTLWLHAANNGHEHAFRDYIVGMARAHPDDLTRRVWYAEAREDDIRGDDNKAPYHFDGLMNLTEVKDLLPLGDKRALYYFCGPVPWMQSVAKQLTDMGVDKAALNFEVFGPDENIV